MGVPEVMDQVRKAEEEADALLAAARKRAREGVELARRDGRKLLDEARQAAAADIKNMEAEAAGETGRLLADLDRKALAEQEAVRNTAAEHVEEACRRAADIFRSTHFAP